MNWHQTNERLWKERGPGPGPVSDDVIRLRFCIPNDNDINPFRRFKGVENWWEIQWP